MFKIVDLIKQEEGTETHEKWGTPLRLTNGVKVWINKDDAGKFWIETDKGVNIKDLLPEGIKYIGHSKSKINIHKNKNE